MDTYSLCMAHKHTQTIACLSVALHIIYMVRDIEWSPVCNPCWAPHPLVKRKWSAAAERRRRGTAPSVPVALQDTLSFLKLDTKRKYLVYALHFCKVHMEITVFQYQYCGVEEKKKKKKKKKKSYILICKSPMKACFYGASKRALVRCEEKLYFKAFESRTFVFPKKSTYFNAFVSEQTQKFSKEAQSFLGNTNFASSA